MPDARLVIQRKSGQLYRRYMTQHILDAAGMHGQPTILRSYPKWGTFLLLIQITGKPEPTRSKTGRCLVLIEVGGGVRSCVLDLMKYGQIYLNDGKSGNGNHEAFCQVLFLFY
ncbi:MAG TPA: hypothetical protein GX729_06375 [Firmicutes bacterium]|nr:hypothetical protein [Bacillota bacterium]